METFLALLALCAGNSPVTEESPSLRPVTRGFEVFFDLRPNKRLSKQSRRRWFETPSPHYQITLMIHTMYVLVSFLPCSVAYCVSSIVDLVVQLITVNLLDYGLYFAVSTSTQIYWFNEKESTSLECDSAKYRYFRVRSFKKKHNRHNLFHIWRRE